MNQENHIKEWSNPTPAGLVALAVACFCFFALLSGKVTHGALPLLGCWLIGGFVVQLIVALLDLKSGNSTGGNTFLFFSAFFMLVGGMEMIMKFNMANQGIVLDARIDGWAWLVLTSALILWTPAFFKSTRLLTIVVLALDVSLPFITLMDLGILDKSYAFIPAYGVLIAGIVAIYLSAAIVVNTAFGKKVYPLPGPF
ncbi:MAG: GPR1/FUN34/YaaH family transporter [Desulfotalea sp.]